ncbi:MAG: glycosyltransferase [Methanobacteriaceae archaeon]|jgi:glycosyltransferase involved in cell wall biosynthesis
MRVLQVTPCFYPAWAYGGPVPVVYHLSKELDKKGCEVIVYTTDTIDANKRQKTKYMEIQGIKVFYFRNISNKLAWRRYFFAPGMILQFRKKIKNFDIIHVHEFWSFMAVIVHYYAQKHGIPYLLQAHGSVETYFHKGMQKKIFNTIWGHRILRDATKLIALTKIEAEQYESMGVREDKIEIIPNGITLTEFENLPQRGEFRKKWSINDSLKVILYLARIHKIKGPDLLAKAFAELLRNLNNVKLVIVGPDDGYLSSLKKLVADLEISDRVLFTGPLYGEDKLEAYVDADVYVLPSAYEIFGIAVLEALACGTPVIVTDRCGIAEVIDNQVGLVVPYDKEQLSNAILRLLGDDKMRQQFGEKGKLLVRERFNWEKIAEQIEKLYQSVIQTSVITI